MCVLDKKRDEERAIVGASYAEASNKANDIALRLLEARTFIYSTLSLEYGLNNEPNEP